MYFILGTTGGDYHAVEQRVARSEICAVAAPNMSAPILLVQAAFEYLASRFPEALQGWNAEIVESHQAGKLDTSGTARKMVEYLKALGTDAGVDRIDKIRDPEVQRSRLNVPEDFLSGHAYHTYTLRSPERSVELRLSHNVLGRATYAAGTLAAVRFLARKRSEGLRGKTFTMLDVLRALGE
jgi:4-hydroxy-tetrahydrodipicolinate reductase